MKLKASETTILKMVSVLFAVVLWLYVLGTESSQIEKTMAVEFILPKGLAITSMVPNELKFTLQGPRAFMRTIVDSDESMLIDLNRHHNRGGKVAFSLRVRDEDLGVPLGVSILKVEPEVLNIKLEKELRKTLKVVPHFNGKVDANYRLVEGRVLPETLEIRGPSSLVGAISELTTQIIDLSKLENQGPKEVQIADIDPRITVENKGRLEFHYTIRPLKANLSLNNVKIRFLTSGKVLKTSHKSVSLLVLAKEGDKTRVRASEVEVVADIPEGQVGKMTVPLKANLPEGLHLLEIRPGKIFVTIK